MSKIEGDAWAMSTLVKFGIMNAGQDAHDFTLSLASNGKVFTICYLLFVMAATIEKLDLHKLCGARAASFVRRKDGDPKLISHLRGWVFDINNNVKWDQC
jgi:hypothetical protein